MSLLRFKSLALASALTMGSLAAQAATTVLTEGFDSVPAALASGWVETNLSAPGGSTGWYQGETSAFTALSGADDSYVAANFNNALPGDAIQNWLITPQFTLSSLAKLVFSTRTDDGSTYSDRLEVRYNASGSTNTADFTELLFTINDTEASGGYVDAWTEFSATFGGWGDHGRIAFVYSVSDSDLANYIGIDSVSIQNVPEPTSLALVALGLVAAVGGARRRSV